MAKRWSRCDAVESQVSINKGLMSRLVFSMVLAVGAGTVAVLTIVNGAESQVQTRSPFHTAPMDSVALTYWEESSIINEGLLEELVDLHFSSNGGIHIDEAGNIIVFRIKDLPGATSENGFNYDEWRFGPHYIESFPIN